MKEIITNALWVILSLLALSSIVYLFLFRSESPPTPEGCYVKTDEFTRLLSAPDFYAEPVAQLPHNMKYQVLEIREIRHIGEKYRFFLIEDQKLSIKGWVQTFELDYTDPVCFQ